MPVVLRKPDGTKSVGLAHLDIPLLNNGRNAHEPYLFLCLLANMKMQDVPIGTEIWITGEPINPAHEN